MLWPAGELLGFDLETTGLDPESARPVSFALCSFRGGKVETEIVALVNPGIAIPAEATAIHGLTDQRVQEEGVALEIALRRVLGAVTDAGHKGVPVVGMNLAYDLRILDRLGREILGEGLGEGGWAGPAIDALVLDRHCDRFRKGRRRLADLCAHYGISLGDAHEAGADARAACRVVLALAHRYPHLAQASLSELYQSQAEWHRAWATEYSSWRESQGREPLTAAELSWPLAL